MYNQASPEFQAQFEVLRALLDVFMSSARLLEAELQRMAIHPEGRIAEAAQIMLETVEPVCLILAGEVARARLLAVHAPSSKPVDLAPASSRVLETLAAGRAAHTEPPLLLGSETPPPQLEAGKKLPPP
jgi:hypothetical protein